MLEFKAFFLSSPGCQRSESENSAKSQLKAAIVVKKEAFPGVTRQPAGWTVPTGTASFFPLPAADTHTLTGNVMLPSSEIILLSTCCKIYFYSNLQKSFWSIAE